VTRVWIICWAAFLIGGAGLFAASRRSAQPVRRARLTKFVTYFGIVNGMLLGAEAGRVAFSVIVVAIALMGAQELIALLPTASGDRWSVGCAMCSAYLLIAAGAVAFAWQARPALTMTIYMVICTFDGFSQVKGQLLGWHKLVPRLRQDTTMEGTAGGVIAGLGMMLLLRPTVEWSFARCLAAGCCLAVAALAGDLLASAVKRRSGVKDFGTRLPGHGGILDRFDSFLFACSAWAAVVAAAGIWGNRNAW